MANSCKTPFTHHDCPHLRHHSAVVHVDLQRADRAGYRLQSAETAIGHCRLGEHDGRVELGGDQAVDAVCIEQMGCVAQTEDGAGIRRLHSGDGRVYVGDDCNVIAEYGHCPPLAAVRVPGWRVSNTKICPSCVAA